MKLTDWYHNVARSLARRRLIGLVAALLAAVCSLLLLLFLLGRPKAHADASAHAAQADGPIGLSSTCAWFPEDGGEARSVAWGDVDGDGDLDLAVGYVSPLPAKVYLSDGGGLQTTAAWTADEAAGQVAWGDVDGDGDLDLAASGDPFKVYLNRGGVLESTASWVGDSKGENLAWGDMNGDGYLDLAVSRGRTAAVCLNVGGVLQATDIWTDTHGNDDGVQDVAWGDVDNDGDLDLAVGYRGYPITVYENTDGVLVRDPVLWQGDLSIHTTLAWGDVNGDGYPELAAGDDLMGWPAWVNGNVRGSLQVYRHPSSWHSNEAQMVFSVAWGDVDGDGDLDLAVGTSSDAPDRVYLNDGNRLQPDAAWESQDTVRTYGLAWGDMDGDGDLDLAVAAEANPPGVYLNDLLPLQTAPVWTGTVDDTTNSVAWGDVDGDGDLDLAVGNAGQPNKVYLNVDGMLTATNVWTDGSNDSTTSVAWGDVDGDGDLDLAVGKAGQPNEVYPNVGGVLTTTNAWTDAVGDTTNSVAWGDVDGDGDLDLAVGNAGQPNKVYPNDEGLLQTSPIWMDVVSDTTRSAAWGDVDGDGDLDLAIGNAGTNKVYVNVGGVLQTTATWVSRDGDNTFSVAWGDVDRDGDLDLAVGNDGPNRVYLNVDGVLEESAAWVSGDRDDTRSVAWGDADGDGDLDLAAGNGGGYQGRAVDPDKIYMNVGGVLQTAADELWMPATRFSSRSVAWGDVDGDGDLDLAAGTVSVHAGQTRLFLNGRAAPPLNPGYAGWLASGLDSDPVRTFSQMVTALAPADFYAVPGIRASGVIPITYTLSHPTADRARGIGALYSPDGGGRWYTATATADTITRNLATGHVASTLPDLDLTIPPGSTISSSLSFGHSGQIHDLEVAVHLDHAQPGQLQASLWSPWPSPGGTTVVLFDGVGTSDGDFANVVLGDRYSRSIATTVGSTNTVGAYSPLDPLARLYGAPLDVPITLFITNTSGVTGTLHMWRLKSLGETYVYNWDVLASGFLGQSDNVVVRIEAYDVSCCDGVTGTHGFTNSVPGPYYRPYYATAQTFPFRVRGNQVRVFSGTVPVSNALVYRIPSGQARGEPIVDAAGHPFRTDLQGYLQGRGVIGAGDTLVALLPISATDAYTLYYTNAAPTPTGLEAHTVDALGVQTLIVSSTHPLLLFDLDVSLEWDARNDDLFMAQLEYDLQRTSALLYDWTDGQAALGNVTVYHDREQWNEADVRVYATNRMRPNAAQGGISSDVISDTDVLTLTYGPGQVHMGAVWNRYGEPSGSLGEDWPRTLGHELGHYALFLDDNYLGLDASGLLVPVAGCTGAMSDPYRTDYPYDEFHAAAGWLPSCEQTLSQQTTGRSDWQTVEAFYPWLDGTHDNAGPSSLPLAVTQIAVVEPVTPATTLADPTFYLVDEWGTQVQPGASARAFLFQGNRLTDLGRPVLDRVVARGARVGDRLCVYELAAGRLGCEEIATGDEQLELAAVAGWRPNLVISPVTSRTIGITVTNVEAELVVQARLYPLSGPATDAITLTEMGGEYVGEFMATEPALAGYVHVQVVSPSTPLREVVADYALGGNPGRSRGGCMGFQRNRQAPAMSADGQVILFGDLEFDEGEFFALQGAPVVEGVPEWMSVVGQAYRLVGSADAPDLSGASISFAYLGSEVPLGQEAWIKVYYQAPMSSTWQVLPTHLDTYHNTASAPVQGEGSYVLMTSIELPLYGPGWNNFAYPVPETRPVAEALQSISGTYGMVYGYRPTDLADPWKLYAPTVPPWVNDLDVLEFGQGYWISMTQPITLHLKGATNGALDAGAGLPMPPATFYGLVQPGPNFTPAAGMTVTAWIDGHLCGQSVLTDVVGYGVAYAVDVMADDGGAWAGCGAPGRGVSFRVGSQAMIPTAAWSNDRVWELALRQTEKIYLPLVMHAYTLAPDLAVESFVATPNSVQIVVRNQGNAAVTADFWVDVYIDPNPVPTHVNQLWSDLADEGLVWGVTADLSPGEVLTLTVGDAYHADEYSRVLWPLAVGTDVYVQVDSTNLNTTYGAVLEDHEISGGSYNNIGQTTIEAAGSDVSAEVVTGKQICLKLQIEWSGKSTVAFCCAATAPHKKEQSQALPQSRCPGLGSGPYATYGHAVFLLCWSNPSARFCGTAGDALLDVG